MKLENNVVLNYFAIWIILLLITISNSNASSVVEVSMDEMLQQSQLVFEGTVTAIKCKRK